MNRIETDHLNREIVAYEFDTSLALHTEISMYIKGNPLIAKWYLESLKRYGLFAQTERQLMASRANDSSWECHDSMIPDMVRELLRSDSIKTIDGWYFPGEGALKHLRIGEGEDDFSKTEKIEIVVKRDEQELARYGSDLKKN